jgi:branched-chain amino acid transport system permease protein
MTAQTIEAKKSFNAKDWIDKYPHYFLLFLISVPALFLMPFTTWLTMTVAGLAMGLMIFIMASGMTLTFGLMHVLNLGHGAFITLGAFAGGAVLLELGAAGGSGWGAVFSIVPALIGAILLAALAGYFFERVIIRPVYHDALKQILVTVGGAIVLAELMVMYWGPNEIPLPRPELLRGSFIVGGVAIEKYRLLAVVVGLLIYVGMLTVINKTKVGLLIRAGVEKVEMVEALGYRVRLLFIGVFIAGSALAAIGGVMWGLYEELIHVHMGDARLVQVIIVIIIGGLGSITGCFYGALMVGLLTNYAGFLEPGLAEFSSIALMVAVLMWRPQGLIPVIKV